MGGIEPILGKKRWWWLRFVDVWKVCTLLLFMGIPLWPWARTRLISLYSSHGWLGDSVDDSRMSRPPLNNLMNLHRRGRAMGVLDGAVWLAGLTLVVSSAIWTKSNGTNGVMPALVGLDRVVEAVEPQLVVDAQVAVIDQGVDQDEDQIADQVIDGNQEPIDPSYRYFDGKLIRPARVIYMTVTGYSPDEQSCGEFADGKTATMYSVWTNGMNLVAADPKILPYWSMISIPGYANAEIVPVLDCGGAIKGNRLDLLYPTHQLALNWGVRQVPVTVWEFVEAE